MSRILETERLILRPPRAEDIGQFVPLLDDWDVAKNFSRVPYPYTEDDAHAFIAIADRGWASGEDLTFAILGKSHGACIGMCGIHPLRNWEIGYWLGKPYWGQGLATEAARAIVEFAFNALGAETLAAGWFQDNPASGRVLEKLGFVGDGVQMRSSLSRGGDVFCHNVVLKRADFERRKDLQ